MPLRLPHPPATSRSLHQSLSRSVPKHPKAKKSAPPPPSAVRRGPSASPRRNPSSPSIASTFVPSSTSPTIVLYEGPRMLHPLWIYGAWAAFAVSGYVIAFELAEHLVWPPFSMGAEPVSAPKRLAFGIFTGGMCFLAGGAIKAGSSKNITRMVVRYNQLDNTPWVTIRTATSSLIPRHLLMGFDHFIFPRRIPIAPRLGSEFTVPLSTVSRNRGSAVARGYVNARTGRGERAAMMIDIGRVIYDMDVSGTSEPVKPDGKTTFGYMIRWLVWKFVRGGPRDPPQLWSRQAFDEMIPQQSMRHT